jgi:hypothetical protein
MSKPVLATIVVTLATLGGVAGADLVPPPPPAGSAAGSANGSAESATPAGSAVVSIEACRVAIAGDPGLAKELGDATLGADVAAKRRAELDKEAGDRRRQQDDEARDQSTRQIALDQRQVILAYAAMWVIAAGFVVYLWRKQGMLKGEIGGLRRELEDAIAREAAAAKKPKPEPEPKPKEAEK